MSWEEKKTRDRELAEIRRKAEKEDERPWDKKRKTMNDEVFLLRSILILSLKHIFQLEN